MPRALAAKESGTQTPAAAAAAAAAAPPPHTHLVQQLLHQCHLKDQKDESMDYVNVMSA